MYKRKFDRINLDKNTVKNKVLNLWSLTPQRKYGLEFLIFTRLIFLTHQTYLKILNMLPSGISLLEDFFYRTILKNDKDRSSSRDPNYLIIF